MLGFSFFSETANKQHLHWAGVLLAAVGERAHHGGKRLAVGAYANGPTASPRSRERDERWRSAHFPLFYSVWDPRPRNDSATHRVGLPPQSTQCRNHFTGGRKKVNGGDER